MMDWYESLEAMIKRGRYPSKKAMELKIANFVAEDLITPEEGLALKELLDKR